MRVLAAVTLAAVAIGILGARASADAEATKLVGSVANPGTIGLKHEDGTPVTTLAPGSYDLEVTDSSTVHNFHLNGPGPVDQMTSVPAQETKTWSLQFVEGMYHYICDAHPTLAGHFTVAAAQPPPPPPPGPPAPPPPTPPSPAPPPPPPPPIQHPPPLATLSRLSVRVLPGRVVVASVHAGAPTRATMELRRGARRVQSKQVALRAGKNVVRMQVRRGVRAGRYVLVVRTSAGRALSYRLRLR